MKKQYEFLTLGLFFSTLVNLKNGTKLENDCLGAIMTSEYSKKHVVYQLKGVECKTKVKSTN